MGTDVQPGTLGGEGAELEEHGSELNGSEPSTSVEEAARKKPTSPARIYLVLQEESFEDGSLYYVQIGEVQSRNAQNALRKAARELRDQLGDSAVLLVVPKTVWRPTPVTLTVNESVSVAIG